jgi:hypothetical protein
MILTRYMNSVHDARMQREIITSEKGEPECGIDFKFWLRWQKLYPRQTLVKRHVRRMAAAIHKINRRINVLLAEREGK